MQIQREDGTHIGSVWVDATRAEAFDLLQHLLAYACPEEFDALWDLIRDTGIAPHDPGWHMHVGSPDELTLAIAMPGEAG
jgi:hypothetical protein